MMLASAPPHHQVYVMERPAIAAPRYAVLLVKPAASEVVMLPDWLQRALLLIGGQGLAILQSSWTGPVGAGSRHWQVALEAGFKSSLGGVGPALCLSAQLDWHPWTVGGHLAGKLSGAGWFLTGDGIFAHAPFTMRLSLTSSSSWGYSGQLTLHQAF